MTGADMEFFRVSRNAWGQEVLIGASWDPLWLFVAAGVLFIIVHMIYMRFRADRKGASSTEERK